MNGPLALLPLAALLACGGKSPEAPEAAPTAPGPDAVTQAVPATETPAVPETPEIAEPAQSQGMVGTWQSDSCEGREWVRALSLAEDNTWTGKDLVAPCPPDVTCIWSGIVTHSGSWKASEMAGAATLVAKTSSPETAPGGVALPTALKTAGDALTDDKGCTYARVQAMP